MAIDARTFLDDQESLRALINKMPREERIEYMSYGAREMESAFPGRKMIIYTLRGGFPSDIEVVNFGSLICKEDEGPMVDIQTESTTVHLSTTPVRVPGRDLFMHVPQNFALKYKGRENPETGVTFVSHYAVLIKARSKEIHQTESHTYCVAPNKFRERFPDLKIRF